jgi:hypothetical protein
VCPRGAPGWPLSPGYGPGFERRSDSCAAACCPGADPDGGDHGAANGSRRAPGRAAIRRPLPHSVVRKRSRAKRGSEPREPSLDPVQLTACRAGLFVKDRIRASLIPPEDPCANWRGHGCKLEVTRSQICARGPGKGSQQRARTWPARMRAACFRKERAGMANLPSSHGRDFRAGWAVGKPRRNAVPPGIREFVGNGTQFALCAPSLSASQRGVVGRERQEPRPVMPSWIFSKTCPERAGRSAVP